MIVRMDEQPRLFMGWPLGRMLAICCLLLSQAGCLVGPRALVGSRLPYNDAVKSTSEQQLLLNIVRLRYVDSPSSLSISSIAEQRELSGGVNAMPFFTSAAAGTAGTYRGSVLPQLELSGANRPTLSYEPQDDQEFTRKLFTPISLDGVAYLSKTTWPVSTVFRLYLENLNWVSNAETASGPTPVDPPEFAQFREGIEALQRLQDRKLVTLYSMERDAPVSGPLPHDKDSATVAVEAVKNGLDVQSSDAGLTVVRRRKQPVLRADEAVAAEVDWAIFCEAFRLDPEARSFDLTNEQLDPYLKDAPPTGLQVLDLETRSLLQVLFFVSHGVEVPREHLACGKATLTRGYDGRAFDWNEVVGGLFHVCSVKSKKPPPVAHVAVSYQGYWFYIDERDRATKATFALLLEVSRLELESAEAQSFMFTLPLGGTR